MAGRLGTGNSIYKFNCDGKLMETYNGASECAAKNKIHRVNVYKAVNHGSLVSRKFYLSLSPIFDKYSISFMISKSKEECNHAIEDFTIISNYSKNLLITLQREHHKFKAEKIQSILTELINCNNYIS